MKKNIKKKDKKSLKQKLIICSLWGGIAVLSAGISGGIASTWHSSSSTNQSIAPEETSTNESVLLANSNYSANSQINNYSPLMFATTNSLYKNNVIKALNTLGFSFLNVYNSNSLQIQNYILSTQPTLFDSTVDIGALQIYNPDSISVSFNYQTNNHTFNITIPSKTAYWIYNTTTGIKVSSAEPSNVSLSTLVSIGDLENVFSESKDGGISNPKLPVETTYNVAKSQLSNSSEMLAAIKEDIAGMIANVNSYDKTSNQIKIDYNGTDVELMVTKALSIDVSQIKYDSTNDTVTLPSLTGSLQVTVSGTVLDVNIDNTTPFTLNVESLLMWQDSNSVNTFPSINENGISGVTLNSGGNPPSYSSGLKWGYLLSSSEPLDIKTSSGGSVPISVSFSYLFYNYWMLQHPSDTGSKITFGSMYDNGNVSMEPSGDATIPSSWEAITKAKVANEGLSVSFDADSTFIDELNNFMVDSSKTLNITITQDNYPQIYNDIISQVTWLNSNYLNSNLTIDGFDVSISLSSLDQVLINLNDVLLSNNENVQTGDINIDYMLLNGKYYVVYPSDGNKNIVTTIPFTDTQLTVNLSSITNKTTPNLSTSINVATAFPSDYYSLDMFESAVKSGTIQDSLIKYLTDSFDISSDWTISDIKIGTNSNNVYGIESFDLSYTNSKSDGYAEITINGKNYVFLNNQKITISDFISLTGFVDTIIPNNNADISKADNAEFSNLLTTNFLSKSNSDVQNNSDILQAIQDTLFGTNITGFSVVGYTSDASQTVSSSITITGLTLDVTTAFYYGDTLLKPGINNLTRLKLIITGFSTNIGLTNAQLWTEYYDQAQDWLNNLSLQDIENDFNLLGNIKQYESSLPAPTDLTYSNFSVKLSNWNPKTNEITLNSLNWDMSGDALDVPLVGTYGINVQYDDANVNETFKLVPVIYYMQDNKVYSYPQINATKTGYQDIEGIDKTYTSLNTSLSSLGDTSYLPNLDEVLSTIHFGYYLEALSSNSTYGTGVTVKTTGGNGEPYKPYLNLSNVFNLTVMTSQFNSSGDVTGGYGSLSSKVTDIKVTTPIVYGSVDDSVKLNNEIDATSISSNFLSFFNDLYSSDKSIDDALVSGLNSALSVTNYNVATGNDINSFYITNDSSVTYELDFEGKSYFAAPYQSTDIVLTSPITFDTSTLNTSSSVNLQDEYNANNSYATAYFHNTEDLLNGWAYLYPLLWDQDNWKCLSSTWSWSKFHYVYSWGEGSKVFTMNESSWKTKIDASEHATIHIYTAIELLANSSIFNNYITSYNINYAGNDTLLISSITLNGATYNNLQLEIIGGGSSFAIA